MASDPRTELVGLASEIDRAVKSLPILPLAARAIVASIHLLDDWLLDGAGDQTALRAIAAVGRLAYIAPLLERRRPCGFG